jgi:3D (Asp-Asp-Asp) domain-containing protein
VRSPTPTWPLLGAALLSGIVLTGSIPMVGAAQPGPSLASRAGTLRTSESAALLQLYAAEAALARAEVEQARLDSRSSELERAEADATLRTEIVRRSLDASQRRIATLLRELYIQGEPDPIAVILGATTLEEVISGIDNLSRATAQNERLAREAAEKGESLSALRVALAGQRDRLDSARAAARDGTARLAAAVSGQRQTLARIRRQADVTQQRLAALQAQAQAAEQRSAAITAAAAAGSTAVAASEPAPATTSSATTTPASPATPAPTPVTGTHTLVVDAVAYHLPGHTASGLPVGIGVIAVDPTVIPLGTRVYVPGYGPAVAADVGTAIKGNIIDLWMPTTAQALAWGRRTVTITVYG